MHWPPVCGQKEQGCHLPLWVSASGNSLQDLVRVSYHALSNCSVDLAGPSNAEQMVLDWPHTIPIHRSDDPSHWFPRSSFVPLSGSQNRRAD